MLIFAAYRITLSGVVLLDIPDLTDGEVSIATARAVQRVEPIRAAHAVEIPRGNVRWNVAFTRQRTFASAVAARLFMFAHGAAIDALAVAADCTLEALDQWRQPTGDIITIANTVLAPNGYSPTTVANHFRASYTLSGGAVTLTHAN